VGARSRNLALAPALGNRESTHHAAVPARRRPCLGERSGRLPEYSFTESFPDYSPDLCFG